MRTTNSTFKFQFSYQLPLGPRGKAVKVFLWVPESRASARGITPELYQWQHSVGLDVNVYLVIWAEETETVGCNASHMNPSLLLTGMLYCGLQEDLWVLLALSALGFPTYKMETILFTHFAGGFVKNNLLLGKQNIIAMGVCTHHIFCPCALLTLSAPF